MFWANKVVEVERIDEWVFTNYNTIKCRYSPKKFQSMRELETKQNHITFFMFCDTNDIFVKDKVIDWDRSFIVSGVSGYWDNHWKHLEVTMVEINSRLHENISIITLWWTQTNYDTLMWEWVWIKTTTTKTVSVLMDVAQALKSDFIKMLWGWKMENVEYIMTLQYPENIAKTDKVLYNWIEYGITWILPFPHQQLVWLSKNIINYDINS